MTHDFERDQRKRSDDYAFAFFVATYLGAAVAGILVAILT